MTAETATTAVPTDLAVIDSEEYEWQRVGEDRWESSDNKPKFRTWDRLVAEYGPLHTVHPA